MTQRGRVIPRHRAPCGFVPGLWRKAEMLHAGINRAGGTWVSLQPGQHQKEHIWHRDVGLVHEGGCAQWLGGGRGSGWGLLLSPVQAQPHALLPAAGGLLLPRWFIES